MLRTQITREQIEVLAEDIRTYFDPQVLMQGLEYHQKGYVYNAEVKGSTYHAKVQGTRVFDAAIDLDFISASHCSCGREYCEHLAAAFFYAYAAYGRPDSIIKQVTPEPVAPSNTLDQSSLHRITSMLTQSEPAANTQLREGDAPEHWLQYLSDTYRSFSHRQAHHKAYPNEYFTAFIQMTLQPASWWQLPYRALFQICASLFAMQQTDELHAQLLPQTEAKISAFQKTVKMLSERLTGAVKELASTEWKASQMPYLEFISRVVRDQLTARADTLNDWLHLYRYLWSKLLHKTELLGKEQALLERTIAEALYTSSSLHVWQTDRLLLAAAHFDIIAKRDQDAVRRLESLGTITMGDFLIYLHSFTQNQQWDRLLHWLRWLLPALKKAEKAEFNLFCDYWSEAVKNGAPEEEWMDALRSLLPRSYEKYMSLLVQRGRHREWVSFHLAYAISPLSISSLDLKRIEEADPGLLLPLYHQAIERSISAKSREAYKQAILLLKKLKLIYASLNNPARFDEFLQRLMNQYARLRAFQEELRRGKLLK
jgi:hypothetical protein